MLECIIGLAPVEVWIAVVYRQPSMAFNSQVPMKGTWHWVSDVR